MSRVLRLESFLRPAVPVAPPQPSYDAAALAEARAEGRAEGRAEARDEDQQALRAAVSGLAVALADDEARRAGMSRIWSDELRQVAFAITAMLAGPLRAEALAARVAAALAAELEAGTAAPPDIRCEAEAAVILKGMLAACGAVGVQITASGRGASFAVGDGVVTIDPDRAEAALRGIIAEIGTANGAGDASQGEGPTQ